jgi:DNA-binding NarL/FixJ family response regulator
MKDALLLNETALIETTIMLVDDHPLVRTALSNEIAKETKLKVIAEASDGLEAVKLANELKPDIIVMDIGLPNLNGIEATRQIKAIKPDTIILALTVHDDIEHILGILESGADGYITKNVLAREIIQYIHSVIGRGTVLSPNIFRQVLKYALRHNVKQSPLNTVPLTIRELEVLKLVAKGLTNKKIADELGIGIRTIKSHLMDIFTKLNAFSRTEAVITALRVGLLSIDDLG